MDKASELGIGSRVKHPDYGLGVVVNVKGKYATIHHKNLWLANYFQCSF